jgi:hypothetical protein
VLCFDAVLAYADDLFESVEFCSGGVPAYLFFCVVFKSSNISRRISGFGIGLVPSSVN